MSKKNIRAKARRYLKTVNFRDILKLAVKIRYMYVFNGIEANILFCTFYIHVNRKNVKSRIKHEIKET